MALNVLIADDHPDEVIQAKTALESMGHKVTLTTTYTAAEERLSNEFFDIAVIDLGWFTDPDLSKMSDRGRVAGWKLADIAKDHSVHVRVLYSSRIKEPDVALGARDRGMLPVQKHLGDDAAQRHLAEVLRILAHLCDMQIQARDNAAKYKARIDELEGGETQLKAQIDDFEKLQRRANALPQLLWTSVLCVLAIFVIMIAGIIISGSLATILLAGATSLFLLVMLFLATRRLTHEDLKALRPFLPRFQK